MDEKELFAELTVALETGWNIQIDVTNQTRKFSAWAHNGNVVKQDTGRTLFDALWNLLVEIGDVAREEKVFKQKESQEEEDFAREQGKVQIEAGRRVASARNIHLD